MPGRDWCRSARRRYASVVALLLTDLRDLVGTGVGPVARGANAVARRAHVAILARQDRYLDDARLAHFQRPGVDRGRSEGRVGCVDVAAPHRAGHGTGHPEVKALADV